MVKSEEKGKKGSAGSKQNQGNVSSKKAKNGGKKKLEKKVIQHLVMGIKGKQLVNVEPINKKWHQMPEKNQERKNKDLCHENSILLIVSTGMHLYTIFSRQ